MYKDAEKQRDANRKAQQKRRQGMTGHDKLNQSDLTLYEQAKKRNITVAQFLQVKSA